jgi:hypothetical protein
VDAGLVFVARLGREQPADDLIYVNRKRRLLELLPRVEQREPLARPVSQPTRP